jgi:ABC-type transport system involved in multi-copper enzyme maturation permease subunit
MTFLPIVARELGVASRRRATFWTRLIFAGMAVVIAMFAFILYWVRPGVGAGVFVTLGGMGFAFCALAGVFLTADCLSEEKREGTLGLLFLTDLRGYDIILGKLFATSLTAFYGVFALFPVLALTLTLGGVTAGEFWRMVVTFLNTLFLSLTAGMLVSVLSRQPQRAMAATAALLVGIVVLPPVLHSALSAAAWGLPAALLQFSPLWGWMRSFDGPYGVQPREFWRCVLAVQALSWTFLLLAAVLLPRVWQEGRAAVLRRPMVWRLTPAVLARRSAQRREMMVPNPIRWLAQRGSVPVWTHGLAFAALGALLALLSPFVGTGGAPVALLSSWFLPIALRGAVAIEASRFFVEARQTGLLELLRCAPLAPWQLVDGPWLALIRRFWIPVFIVAFAQLAPALGMPFAGPGVLTWGPLPSAIWSGVGVIGLLLDLCATVWVGMLLGLTTRKPSRAAGFTVLWMVLVPLVVPCLGAITFLIDLPLIFWARGRLQRELRSAGAWHAGPTPDLLRTSPAALPGPRG